MPATSGKVRMPHNNRISSSSALNTNSMWSKTIGIDPYKSEQEQADAAAGDAASEHAAGLMLLARMTNVSGTGNEMRGGCPKCGEKGHLRFQCRNTLKVLPTSRTTAGNGSDSDSDSSSSNSDDDDDDDDDDQDRKHTADNVIPSASSVVVGTKRNREEDFSTERNRNRDHEQFADNNSKKHQSSSSSSSSSSSKDKKHHKKEKKSKHHKKKDKKEKKKSSKHKKSRKD